MPWASGGYDGVSMRTTDKTAEVEPWYRGLMGLYTVGYSNKYPKIHCLGTINLI